MLTNQSSSRPLVRLLGSFAVVVPLVALGGACGPSSVAPDGPGAPVDAPTVEDVDAPVGDDRIDAPPAVVVDATNVYGDADIWRFDAGCVLPECSNPVGEGCVAVEACGDGLDNNCNGEVDEDCPCTVGAVQACFLGPPGRRGVGSCEDGTQTCQGSTEFHSWGPCTGGIWPGAEQCDTQDNNCNGCVDDNPACCVVDLACPGPGDLPEAAPFEDYVIDGSRFYDGPATRWSWTVSGGPCDQLLYSTSGETSYTLSGTSTSRLTFHPTLSGDYTVTMTVSTPDGDKTCTFLVHVRGPGVRVELCWDTTGLADIDLHVHRSGTTTSWFEVAGEANPDDCYYQNCGASPYPYVTEPNWGYAASALTECRGGPEGDEWVARGSCRNPRLDIDNIDTPGVPENINIDKPNNGDTFRVMVHYYDGSQATHPLVNVYCGGTLLGTYGAAPDQVSGFTSGGSFAGGPMWRVVDVAAQVSGGTTTGCNLTPLHPSGSTSGYWVTDDDTSY